MNKILLLVVFGLLGAGIFTALYFFDPLPPYTTTIVTSVQSFAKTIGAVIGDKIGQVTSLLNNPAVVATLGVTGGTLVTNYIKEKVFSPLKKELTEKRDQLQSQVIKDANLIGQQQVQIKRLKTELEKANLVDVQELQGIITKQQKQIEKLQNAKNELARALAEKHIITKEIVH